MNHTRDSNTEGYGETSQMEYHYQQQFETPQQFQTPQQFETPQPNAPPPEYNDVVNPNHDEIIVPTPSAPPISLKQPNQIPLQINDNVNDNTVQNEVEQQELSKQDDIGCCSGLRESSHCKSFWITLIIIGFIVTSIIMIEPVFLIGAGICYILYMIEYCCSSTRKYLSNIHDSETVNELMINARNTAPIITWNVQCYHYETRTYWVTVTDSDGRSRQEMRTETVRRNTHYASTQFDYKNWRDISQPWITDTRHQLCKITCDKSYCFANIETERYYHQRKQQFKRLNDRDVYQDFSESLKIPGMKKKILAETNPGGSPCCVNSGCFHFLSFFLCTWCYRCWFSSIVTKRKYLFVKQVSAF